MRTTLAIKASINQGLSPQLKSAFPAPDVVPVNRPAVTGGQKIYEGWMQGFVSAEGCFYIELNKDEKSSIKGNCKANVYHYTTFKRWEVN